MACRAACNDVRSLRYQEVRNDVPTKTFFPLNRLKSYFTVEKVTEILLCKCDDCREDAALFEKDPAGSIEAITGGNSSTLDPQSTNYALFGLLVYVGHPLFVIGFNGRPCNDHDFEMLGVQGGGFSREKLKTYTRRYSINHSKSFKGFVMEFSKAFSEFAVPHMDSGAFERYDVNTILPFINEEEIVIDDQGRLTSEGANGRVFRFQIHREYNRFPHARGIEWYARKKIETPELRQYLEHANLQHAQRFSDDHIVKLIKAYRQGDNINLIFPLAKTNLNHLLRTPAFDYGKSRGGPLESCNAWEQLLGIAEALRKIGGFTQQDAIHQYESSSTFERLCIHFDLKPDNILIEHDNTWVITDFGQAAITDSRTGGTPHVTNHWGTIAYAPPEVNNVNMVAGRKYDIWSLGCITLEVTAFIVLGYAGLRGSDDTSDRFSGLDNAIRAQSGWKLHGEPDRFFYQSHPNGPFVVKREISEFMNFLQNRVDDGTQHSKKSKAFLSKILNLIDRMLQPNPEDRIDIIEVVRTLSAAIKQAATSSKLGQDVPTDPGVDETVIGGPKLNCISLWNRVDGTPDWDECSLEAFENDGGYIRLLRWTNNRTATDINFDRAHAKLIPNYAFWRQEQSHASGTWLRLCYLSADFPQTIPKTQFSFSTTRAREDARVVQSRITLQYVAASYDLSYVRIKKFVPIFGKTFNKIGRVFGSKRAETKVDLVTENWDFGSATIHLWVEKEDHAASKRKRRQSEALEALSPDRTVRQRTNEDILPRRVVIYLHQQRFICTIKMDVNWVLEPASHDPTVLSFQPHQPNRDPHFVACWIRPSQEEFNEGYPAGIPLCPKVLQFYEDNDRFEADRFDLKFTTAAARESFREKYKEIKYGLHIEQEEMKEQTREYTPINRRPDHKIHVDSLGRKYAVMPRTKAKFQPEQEGIVNGILKKRTSLTSILQSESRGSRHDSKLEEELA